jgi:CRP-like cAMP-binding protein
VFALFEHNEEFYSKNSQVRSLLAELLEQIPLNGKDRELRRGEVISGTQNHLYLLKNGVIRSEREKRVVFFLEPGDLVGPNIGDSKSCTTIAHSPITITALEKTAFYEALSSSPDLSSKWDTILAFQFELFHRLLNKLLPSKLPPAPDVRYIAPGDPIIIQETSRNEVYTLLHGKAKVYVQETEVGEILPGEIFGAMAAPMRSTRSASVVAETQCVVSALPQDQFLALVNTHPQTVQKLVKTMSRVIMSQNEQILELKNDDS